MYYGNCEKCKVGHYHRSGNVIVCQQCGSRMADIGKCPECGRDDCLLVSNHCYQCDDRQSLTHLLTGGLGLAV